MNIKYSLPLAMILASLTLAPAIAQAPDARIVEQVRKQIIKLENYDLFDYITYKIDNGTVLLEGKASEPQLVKQAERVVERIEGVNKVINKMEVLPNSNVDDQIRTATYVQIYGHPRLSLYNPNRGTPLFNSLARRTFGLTQDPPPGNHPIHIIVENQHITLTGVVNSEADKNIAGVEANSVASALSVTNNLVVADGDEASE